MNFNKHLKIGSLTSVLVVIVSVGLLYFFTPTKENDFPIIYFSISLFVTTFFIILFLIKKNDDKFASKHNEKDEVVDVESEKSNEIERLKETEEFRKEFIGNLAHELKTPVFSVQGYILTLMEGGLEDETINRKFLKKASKGIERIATVIEDMDTITRIESGRLVLDKKRFNIIDLIQDVFEDLEEVAKNKNTTLAVKNKVNAPVFVMADESKINQVLANLILNAINYGNEKGETVVVVNSQKGKVIIDVVDNGPGIEEEHLSRLFERFFRVEKSRSRNKGGSGIGLAIVKHIIEAHQETIGVESEVNKGTTFSFSLPKVS